MKNQEAYQQAKKRLQLRLGFRIHLGVYIAVNLLLLFINLSTSSDNLWAIWPIFGWGIGLFFHGLNAYSSQNINLITDEMIRKEVEKNSSNLD